MKPHKSLLAWQKSMNLVTHIYELTAEFPREELYGLTSQLRRAAVSVPSNIAEGAADRTKEQFRHFLGVSIGSLNEVSTQLEIAYSIGYLNETEHGRAERKVDECLALTFGLRRSLLNRL
ncbi:MAG: four helix bundle protein [Aridibacter famidurans]|nr:four helix bundle protein [Aridibacter famidurans]